MRALANLAKAVRHSGRQKSPTWALAKPGRNCQSLWKAAGLLAGFGKAQQKPRGTVEDGRASCGLQQSLAKAIGNTFHDAS